MIRLLDGFLRKDINILDAGCGSGFFTHYFIHRGCNAYALDYSKDALEITQKLTKNKAKGYIKEDLLNSRFGKNYKNKFDLIFSDGLFEHFDNNDQVKIMSNFKKVKKKNGIIATFVPNKYSWWAIIRPLFMSGIKEKPFTFKKLISLHNGLEIIEKGGINVIPFFFSPDKIFGKSFGMILYCIAK